MADQLQACDIDFLKIPDFAFAIRVHSLPIDVFFKHGTVNSLRQRASAASARIKNFHHFLQRLHVAVSTRLSFHVDLTTVKSPSFLCVRKQIICCVQFFELSVCVFVAGIEIRMMFLGKFTVSGFDVRFGCILIDA